MRNYQLMRSILCVIARANQEVKLNDFACLGAIKEVREELDRLKHEGLIEHDIIWSAETLLNGSVKCVTQEGEDFLRNIENEHVWALVFKTLEDANLDLSYPLLKEVCDEIVKRYVMSKIPKEL